MMKKHNHAHPFTTTLAAAAVLGSSSVLAGEPLTVAPPMEIPVENVISGTLSLDLNSHFVSYGFDVWGSGSTLDSPMFNPSITLEWDLPGGWSFNVGTWWDVNGNAPSAIGGNLQEVDVFGGLAYEINGFTIAGTYQAWIYGGDTEHVFDLAFSYDTFLSPSLTIHKRFDPGASGGNNGIVLVAGLEYGFDAGAVSFAIPLNVAYFFESDYHVTSTESGFGYASIGLTATYPLAFIDKAYGAWDLNGGLVYYFTDDGVIGNDRDNFLTASIGMSVSF